MPGPAGSRQPAFARMHGRASARQAVKGAGQSPQRMEANESSE
jgi:hypothetical protein